MWKLWNKLFGWEYVWIHDVYTFYIRRVKKTIDGGWMGSKILGRNFFISPTGTASGAYNIKNWKPLTSGIKNAINNQPDEFAEIAALKSELTGYKAQLARLAREAQRLMVENASLKSIGGIGSQRAGTSYNNQLTESEIKTLLSLCHPDKHGGKKIANDMTVKLNEMKKQVRH